MTGLFIILMFAISMCFAFVMVVFGVSIFTDPSITDWLMTFLMGITAPYAYFTFEYNKSEKIMHVCQSALDNIKDTLLNGGELSSSGIDWLSAEHTAQYVIKAYHSKLQDDHKVLLQLKVKEWRKAGMLELFRQPMEFYMNVPLPYDGVTSPVARSYDVEWIEERLDNFISPHYLVIIWDICMFKAFADDGYEKTNITDKNIFNIDPDPTKYIEIKSNLPTTNNINTYFEYIVSYFRVR